MKNLKLILSIVFFFSPFIFSELSDSQLALLEDLPPDQRASLEQKMNDQQELTNDIDDAFEEESYLRDRPELDKLYNNDDYCEDCIYGYNLFKYSPTTFAPANNIPLSDNYTLGPGDKLEVVFYGSQNQTIETLINRNGFIVIPDLGPINISGLTFLNANKLISEKVEQEMIGVKVSIAALELRSISVYILGEAYKPGSYTLSALSTVTNALFQSGGVNKTGSLRNIKIKRNGKVVENFDFYDLLLKGNVDMSNRLQDGDVVFIPMLNDSITLNGSFRRTGRFELKEGDNLLDALTFGGGFKTNVMASPIIEINTINTSTNQREIQYIKAEENLLMGPLRDGDIISVTEIQELEAKTVHLEGEVRFPGAYAVKKGERVYDIIKRAGGYSENAYPSGVFFTRKSIAKKEEELFKMKADELEDMMVDLTSIAVTLGQGGLSDAKFPAVNDLVRKLRTLKPIGRQIVNFNELDLRTDPFSNILLEDGDKLVVPKRSNSIYIIGEVQNPVTARYLPGLKMSEYINLAGGYTDSADHGKIYVVEPDGSSKILKSSLFGSNESFLPGSVIVVTKDYNSVSGINFSRAVAPVVSAFATSIAALAVLSNN
jgi:protein involved in polysaccharide export with SLBB domain